MSDFFPEEGNERQNRARRTAKTQQLYSARPQVAPAPEPYAKDKLLPERGQEWLYPTNANLEFSPNEAHPSKEGFMPNETFSPKEPPALEPEEAYTPNEPAPSNAAAYYRRPSEENDSVNGGFTPQEDTAYAPPPKFSVPWSPLEEADEPQQAADFSHAHVYQPKAATWSETERRENLTLSQAAYRVEAEREKPPQPQRKKRWLRGVGIAACVLAVLGVAGYIGRDWIGEQMAKLTAGETTSVTGQADLAANPRKAKGYDPAPAAKLNDKAQKNIAAISGTLEMETSAITGSHVVTRIKTGESQYDFYLFSGKDGTLLGYYEGVSETGFAPQPNESFYVEQSPYLLSRDGKPLLNTSPYAQYVGKTPVLSPFENGWAIISDADGKTFNYINQEGQLFSTLWFARALPFYGDHTAAYVDTGNLAKPEARYSLYILSADGKMERWQNTADTQGLIGAAGNLALMENGELVSLRDTDQIICTTDSAVAYLDCEAMVVRDQETGKYGLFVKGERHYDFSYDRIEPVPCEMQWKRVGDRGFTLCAVMEAAYPQPLSHYFTLEKDGAEDLVALSTRSVCSIILK